MLAIGCVVLTSVPEQSVPSWLQGAKDIADRIAQLSVRALDEGPLVFVDAIGQGIADQVQTPTGIAALAGEVTGGAAGARVGTKYKSYLKKKKLNVDKTVDVDESDIPKDTNIDEPDVPKTKDVDVNSNVHSDIKNKFNDLLNSDYYKNDPGYDCSEIAQDFYEAANNKGVIYRIEGKNGSINGYEYGDILEFEYHEVYSDRIYIYMTLVTKMCRF